MTQTANQTIESKTQISSFILFQDPYADSSILADQLDLKLQCFEKLDFSKTANVKTEEASCHGDNQTR